MSEEKPSDLIEKRRRKLQELRDSGIVAYPNDFRVSHCIREIQELVAAAGEAEHLDAPVVSAAGRMMAVNRFGKSAFIRFRDRSGQLQAYIQKDKVGEDAYELFKKLEAGDIVGIRGTLFKTRTGEWTLLASDLQLLCKAVRPLPEKFHGLKDPEKRYRQRYLDLIMNPSVREIFIRRSRMIQAVRTFLLKRDFLEVETPMMQAMAGGAEATPFVTHHQALDIDLYLRIAPELYLKRLVVGGFDRVFEINRNFRNEGVSTRHNPEFTMLEFYQAYAVYTDLMELTEAMFAEVTQSVTGITRIQYQGRDIDMAGPYRRIALSDALSDIGGVPKDIQNDREALLAFAQQKGIPIQHRNRLGKILTKLFDVLVEPQLIQPTFVIGYPVEVSPLSRRSDTQPELTERFELFIAGYEIANGFSELNDPEDQYNRFLQQVEDRKAGDREAHQMDMDYIEALEYGLPPTAGEGVGIDRLAMLLTDSASIREVILFPHMKPTTS
ncbi:MAG: lysine--tRNA ligase [Thermodesulfobacteriota bacterium]